MWLQKSPMQDGSGTYLYHGVEVKIIVDDLVSVKHRVAFLNGKEVARASTFPRLLRKLDNIFPAHDLDKCECGGYRKHHPSDRNGGGCKTFRLWQKVSESGEAD